MRKIDQVREQLEQRLVTLGARVGEIEDDLRSAPSADLEEQATETEGDEVLAGIENSALLEIKQIRAAIGRIEDGTYGECMTCGEPIGQKRLKVLPYATQCITCAEESTG